MVRHNNVIPNAHFRKDWQKNVATWFNQPGRKQRRRAARVAKAAAAAPRPASGALRPVVHGQTIRYNTKVRFGRGFSFEELREAGVNPKVAPTIGIAVDHRRRNRSVEGLQANVQRLKSYMANLVVFPKRKAAPKAGDSSAEECAAATQFAGVIQPIDTSVRNTGAVARKTIQPSTAFATLRHARTEAHLKGLRAKMAAEKEEK